MIIEVKKLSTIDDAHMAIESTMRAGFVSKATLDNLYLWEHSPMRTQLFWVEMIGIFTKVSVHLVRHASTGQQHFVQSHREDRGGAGDTETDRLTPVNHRMLLNAQHLIDMSRKRLCYQAESDTRSTWMRVIDGVAGVDPALVKYLVPNCVYRGGLCVEPRPCGKMKVRKYQGCQDWLGMML